MSTGVGGTENKENSEPGSRWTGGRECKGRKGTAREAAKEDMGTADLKMAVIVNFCLREGEEPGKACRGEMAHWIRQTRCLVYSQTETSLFRRAERLSGDGVELTEGMGTRSTKDTGFQMRN